jgi:hypothetical protein
MRKDRTAIARRWRPARIVKGIAGMKYGSRRAAGLVLAAGLLSLATPSAAAPVTYSFTGVLQEAFGSLSGGAGLTGWFSYELAQPDQTPGNANVGSYQISSFSLSGMGGGVSANDSPLITVFNGSADVFELRLFGLAGSLGGIGVDQASIRLIDPSGHAFSSDALPTQLSLADFAPARSLSLVSSFDPLQEARFTLTALSLVPLAAPILVPEPIGLSLLGLGIAGLVSRRRAASGLGVSG